MNYLGALDDDTLASALSATATAGLDADWPNPTDRARLTSSTGWSGAHLVVAVRRAFLPFTPAACRRLVALGRTTANREDPKMRPTAHSGDRRLLAILAGRVPAVATSAVFNGLAARHKVLLKPSSAEPVFARLLCSLVERAAPQLAASLSLMNIPSSDPRLDLMVSQEDAVLAYGSDATIASIRHNRAERLTMGGGHRESVVLCFRDAFDPPGAARRIARAVARDTAIYDQDGCLSPQVILIEENSALPSAAFASLLHEELLAIAGRLPPGPIPLLSAASVRMFIEESRLLAMSTGGLVLPTDGRGPPAVVLVAATLPARPSPGFRVLQVVPFSGEPDLSFLLPHLANRLQGIAIAGDRQRLAATLARHPAYRPYRTCAPGRLQSPPAGWPENGFVVVRELSQL